MPNWKGIVGKNFSLQEFDSYCHTLQWTNWRPSFIVLHNTATPSLAQRPDGLTKEHITSLEAFYRDEQKWSGGPHLFVDDKQIWVFTPLTVSGTHSPSWNKVALGVEMLGDFEKEAFDAGRGLDAQTIRIHRDDPLTTHACPGKNVRKLEIIQEVQDLLVQRHAGEHPIK